MSLKTNIKEEFVRSPVTVIFTVVGVVVAALALLLAWLQYAGQPVAVASNTKALEQSVELHLSNLFVVISYFFASTFSIASLIRLLERRHSFAAAVLSIPAAVLASFISLVVFRLVPPKAPTASALDVAQDIMFWGTLVVFVAVNGRSVAIDIVTSAASPNPPNSSTPNPDGLGVLAVLGLTLAIWGGLVSAGLSKLVQLFFA